MCNTLGNIFRLIIVGGVCLALAMQFWATFSCDFLKAGDETIGVWYRSTDGECDEDSYETDDGVVGGARSALTISIICGFGAGLLVLFEWLCCEVCCAGCIEGLAFAGAWMVGGATFMLYGMEDCGDIEGSITDGTFETGDNGCEYGPGSTYMTIACVCYLGCGVLLCCAPQPDPICKQ